MKIDIIKKYGENPEEEVTFRWGNEQVVSLRK